MEVSKRTRAERESCLLHGKIWSTADLVLPYFIGSTVARYSGDTVHQRLRALDQYKNKNWEDGMRRAFLKTDEDLRASGCYS